MASWTYQATAGNTVSLAEGMAFVLQNDPRGTLALGGPCGALGYGGGTAITPSMALEFNINPNNTVGLAFRTNGATGFPYSPTTPVNIANGHPINVSVSYSGGVMQVTLTDTNLSASFSTNFNVESLAGIVGADSAWVGMTSATGTQDASQTVRNFQFIPTATLGVQMNGSNTPLFSWPASIGGYVLQSNSDLTAGGGWQNVNAPVSRTADQNQVFITPLTGNAFYRLLLQ